MQPARKGRRGKQADGSDDLTRIAYNPDGLIHNIETTAANVHDLSAADEFLHGEEQRVWGDAGYARIHKRDEFKERDVDCRIALRSSTRSKLADQLQEILEGIKASIRAKVEHPFRMIKQ